jgi:hypothetical protein
MKEPTNNSASLQEITAKLESYSFEHEGVRQWNKTKRSEFRSWLIRYLRRHPKARIEMININRSKNNLTHVLEYFATSFVAQVPFKVI